MADGATFSFTSGTPDNIPAGPGGVLNIPITVSGLAGPLSAITVRLDHITAAEFTDLRFLLVAPDGTHNLVFLADIPNGFGYGVTDQTIYVTDYAGLEYSLTVPVVAPLDREFTATVGEYFPMGVPPGFTLNHAVPEGAATFASAFNGIDPNGTWHLIVLDEFSGGGSSTLLGASLHVVTNVAPTITVPTGLSVESGGSIQFLDSSGNIPTGGDPDADFGDFGSFRVTVEHGTLGNTENGIFVHFAPAKDVGIGMGIVGGVHAFFDHATYRPDPGFTGVDHITIEVTDHGDLGLGAALGSLTSTATFAIEVFDHKTGTSGDDSFTASGYQKIDGGAGKDTIKFDFALTQAIVTYNDNTVTVEGPGGVKAVLTGFEKFVFNDGTVDNADGSPLVDDLFYYTHNHDVWAEHVDPDRHYAEFGWHEGRNPNAFFDTNGYLSTYLDVKAAGVNPLQHYHEFGWKEGRDPSTGFDTGDYFAAYTDVNAAHVDPLAHFLQFGEQEGRHAFNDGAWG